MFIRTGIIPAFMYVFHGDTCSVWIRGHGCMCICICLCMCMWIWIGGSRTKKSKKQIDWDFLSLSLFGNNSLNSWNVHALSAIGTYPFIYLSHVSLSFSLPHIILSGVRQEKKKEPFLLLVDYLQVHLSYVSSVAFAAADVAIAADLAVDVDVAVDGRTNIKEKKKEANLLLITTLLTT